MFKLFIVLIFVFLLRLPSLFEPNWYGDEGIYLAIGQALQRGSVLYRDIWDNKTPLLYLIYAIAPVLWWAKLAATFAVLGTCVGVFKIGRSLLATLICGVLLSIPLFEGTIANAEVFFVLPIVWGAYFALNSTRYFLMGLLAGTAFLVKVPAIFDFVGIFVFLILTRKSNFKIIAGFIAPVVLVCLYLALNNSLVDFIQAAFLSNATYVSVGPNPLFIKAVVLSALSLALVVGYFKKIISKELLFLTLWFGFSVFGALLSNRPYMHYLLQIVPPGVLLGTYLIKNIRKNLLVFIVFVLVLFVLRNQFERAFRLSTVPYYKNFINYSIGIKSWQEYVNFFDRNTLKTYEIAKYVRQNTDEDDSIFVWDDASNIYVLSGRKPATKFIQAHHLTLVGSENYELVISDLKKNKPKLILVDPNSRFGFRNLKDFVKFNYETFSVLGGLQIYKINL